MNARSLGLTLALALASCGDPSMASDVGSTAAAIVGGVADDTTTSTVFIFAKVDGGSGYCSGVVVSPHVVLTAAHCAEEDAEYKIFLGPDYLDKAARRLPENVIAVTEHHPHPKHDLRTNMHDIGVLITEKAIPVTPAVMNRKALDKADVGRAVKIVGYGQTSGESDAIGRRMKASTKIAGFDPTGLVFKGVPNICMFDSGGPTYATDDGTDVVVGIHILGNSMTCNDEGVDVRVDPYIDFIDGYIAQHEPQPEPESNAQVGPTPDAPSSDASSSGCALARSHRSSSWAGLALLVASLVLLARRRPARR